MLYLKVKKYFVSLGNLSNSKSVGTNNLIKEFAFITTEPEDILSYFGFIKPIENNNIEKAKAQIIENIPQILLGNNLLCKLKSYFKKLSKSSLFRNPI